MKKLEKLYNKQYSLISIYVVKSALMIFVLGLIIYYLSGKAGGALSFAGAVLQPLVLGMVITYLLSPVVGILERKLFGSMKKQTMRRAAAVLVTYGVIIGLLILALGLIVVTVTWRVSSFNLTELKEQLVVLADQFSRFWSTIEKQLASMNINLGSIGDALRSIFNGVKSGASMLLFAMIFSIYFLLDRGIRAYWGGILGVFTNEKTRNWLSEFAADANKVFSGYIRGQSLDALLVGAMASIFLYIGGIPYAVVIGILTGLGNLVPYVGPIVGFGSLIIICLAEKSVMHLLIGAVILALIMFIDGNVINPRMLSSNVEVHPVLVIVALLAGGKVGGVVGMLIAVPVAALLKLQFEKYVEKRRQHAAELQAAQQSH